MAERTLNEIAGVASGETQSGKPSDLGTVAAVTESFVRFIAVNGPYKTESLLFRQANGNDFKANDTFKSQLAHPLFASVVIVGDRDAATAPVFSVEVNTLESDTNFKTITLRDAEDINSIGLLITVYGF